MEAGGAPKPPPEPPAEPRPVSEEKATGGWRVLGVVLALALAFAAAVMVIAMADIGETPTCDEILSGDAALPADGECFDGSEGQKTATLIFGWPSGVLAALAALLALYFAATGRQGRITLTVTGAAIALGVLSILIGSV